MRVGIHEELAKRLPESERRRLESAIGGYVRSPKYLEALAADQSRRYDIDGEPVWANATALSHFQIGGELKVLLGKWL